MKLFQARSKDGHLIMNDFVGGAEIDKRIYWRDNIPYFLSKDDGLLIPFKKIRITNVYREGE